MSIYITTLATLIVQTYFDKFPCVYNIGNFDIAKTNNKDIVFVKASIEYALNSDLFEQFKCASFLISSDSPNKDVELIENNLNLNKIFRLNTRYYLLIYNGLYDNETFNSESFFKLNVFDLIVNVLLMVEQDGCVHFYTHSYAGKSPLTTKFIGVLCDSYDISTLDLYPNKQDDLLGKELQISTFNFIPYIYLEKNHGAELSVINEFVAKYNYTRKLNINPDLWGILYDNLTGSGAQWDVFQGEADIASAGYFISEFDYKVDPSTFTVRAGLNFLVPRPEISNGFTTLLKPFSYVVWIVLLGVMVALIIVMAILNDFNSSSGRYEGARYTFELSFVVLAVLLQQPVTLHMRMYLIYSGILLIVIFYNCGYSSLLTKASYEPHISNGKELEMSDLPFLLPIDAYVRALDILEYPNIKTKFTIAALSDLQKIFNKTTQVSIVIDSLNLGYALGEYEDALNISLLEKFTVLKEDMSYDLCVFVLYKNSVILPIFDKFLVDLREFGLDYYYLAETFRELDYEEQVYMQNINNLHETTIQYFNIKTLSGAFLILFLGLLIATITFFCEVKMMTFCC